MVELIPTAQLAESGARVWRFMDFTKYVAMLHRQALFFARADQLPDPFEGMHGRHQRRARRGPAPDRNRAPDTVFLSCWHHNEHESAAMWRIYLSSEEGVAIRSTTGRLWRTLDAARETVYLGSVRYVDQASGPAPDAHDLDAYFCNWPSFDYEREVRAVWPANAPTGQTGRHLSVDLHLLIEGVVLSPTADDWFAELVESVTQRYGFAWPVASSTMRDPSWMD